jgi:glycosyltransferase involved in cell wall biosynthesis
VSDDTPDDRIRDMVSRWTVLHSGLRYKEGPRTGNAADNWNSGIAAASGDYILLVHHDEFFVRPDYLAHICQAAASHPGTCVVARSDIFGTLRKSRIHAVARLAKATGRQPWTLYGANWIGPTATFAFPRDIDLTFDRNITSLIDVDFYAQAINKTGQIFLPDHIYVYSVAHPNQISAGHDLTKLNRQEIRYIQNRSNSFTPKRFRIIASLLWLRDMLSGLRPVLSRRPAG